MFRLYDNSIVHSSYHSVLILPCCSETVFTIVAERLLGLFSPLMNSFAELFDLTEILFEKKKRVPSYMASDDSLVALVIVLKPNLL